MSGSQSRLDLVIDIFELEGQPARVLPKARPPQVVEAIVQEFRELEYLANDPLAYYLARAGDQAPLDDAVEMGRQQLTPGARLVLLERQPVAPDGAQSWSRPVYLREQSTGRVFRLHWRPAVIGRGVAGQAYAESQPVAVDLQSLPTGLRVSRRHLLIDESDGQLTIENLAKNPAAIQRGGDLIAVEAGKISLQVGDLIHLERSQIALKVLIRNGQDTSTAELAGNDQATIDQTAKTKDRSEGD